MAEKKSDLVGCEPPPEKFKIFVGIFSICIRFHSLNRKNLSIPNGIGAFWRGKNMCTQLFRAKKNSCG